MGRPQIANEAFDVRLAPETDIADLSIDEGKRIRRACFRRTSIGRLMSKAKAAAHTASASSSFKQTPHRALAAACMSGFLALPFPVACFFSKARWTADHGSPSSSQARTAAPSIGKSALTLENWPENGSSMQTPMQSGPAKRLTIPATPTVRAPILASSRTVWASISPSVNTRATLSDVPRSRPRTYLRPTHRRIPLVHINEGKLTRAKL